MIGIYILIALLLVAFYIHMRGSKAKGWKVVDPSKKGGSFSLYFMDKHIANVRGKTKAMVLLNAIEGKDMTKDLDMTTVKPMSVTKPVITKKAPVKAVVKKVVAKKVATVKAPAKAMAKKVVAKKVAAKKVIKKASKK